MTYRNEGQAVDDREPGVMIGREALENPAVQSELERMEQQFGLRMRYILPNG